MLIIDGYESKEKQTIAKEWIDNNASEIYKAYRKMMFDFEKSTYKTHCFIIIDALPWSIYAYTIIHLREDEQFCFVDIC